MQNLPGNLKLLRLKLKMHEPRRWQVGTSEVAGGNLRDSNIYHLDSVTLKLYKSNEEIGYCVFDQGMMNFEGSPSSTPTTLNVPCFFFNIHSLIIFPGNA